MLTCIDCSKQLNNEDGDGVSTPRTKQASKALTAQIKDIALKASVAYKSCRPKSSNFNQNRNCSDSELPSDLGRFQYLYRSPGSSNVKALLQGKEMERRLKSASSLTESVVLVEEDEPKEWVAQVEPGVIFTFVSLLAGGNDLRRVQFSCKLFNKWQAQRWWTENYDKVMELYNVKSYNRQAFPLQTPQRSENESSKIESAKDSPITLPLGKECLHSHFNRPAGKGYSSSDSLDHPPIQSNQSHYLGGLDSTPNLSNFDGAKTVTSSLDGSVRTSSSREDEPSGKLSNSNASNLETEWVEQDEPGVYITIKALPGGTRKLIRVQFSQEKFGEMQATMWWKENRARIHERYL